MDAAEKEKCKSRSGALGPMDVQVEHSKAKNKKRNLVICFLDGTGCHQSVGRSRKVLEIVSSKNSKLTHP